MDAIQRGLPNNSGDSNFKVEQLYGEFHLAGDIKGYKDTKAAKEDETRVKQMCLTCFTEQFGNELSSVTHPELSNEQTVELDVPKHDPEVKPVLT